MSAKVLRGVLGSVCIVGLLGLAGCHVDMWRQPKLLAQHETSLFPDGSASRPPVPGTIARGHLRDNSVLYTGTSGGQLVTTPPLPANAANLERGKKLFEIHCAPCHGPLGYGNGMIAQRGLALRRTPGNYHTDRLRNMPIGYFYDVMTYGAGVMYGVANRVRPEDRWRIAMYVRVLQLSQHGSVGDLRPEEQTKLLSSPSSATNERQVRP